MPYLGHTILVGASVLAFAVMTVVVWRKHTGPLKIVAAWTGLGIVLTCVLVASEDTATAYRRHLQSELTRFTPVFARRMEQLGHAQVKEGDNSSPLFLRLIEAEKRWMDANPKALSIYTMRRKPDGTYIFLVAAEADLDENGRIEGEREERIVNGEAYDERPPEFDMAYDQGYGFSPKPTTDKWGTWVTAAQALHDADGNTEGVLCIDFPAADWQANQDKGRLRVDVLGAVIVGLLFVFCTVMLRILEDQEEGGRADSLLDESLSESGTNLEKAEEWAAQAAICDDGEAA